MEFLKSYLPSHEGLLPKWLLLISLVSVANSAQTYTNLALTQQVYLGPSTTKTPSKSSSPVTPLSARTFGTWTFLSSIIRLYAAYYIDNKAVYEIAMCSFAVAWAHFVSEWLWYGTARWGKGLAGPATVSSVSLVWMLSQWKFYVPS
ncbi:ergosterol 28 [Lepidopterella palustris CBS 459.81]|uniref:Ergosterol 28 n=1 Tax=Lepidopterella palustris CBS 459.81 TaxID=1314670 RepID=A0A8E2EDP7_9PEZI|nr:ergosterol 28 [Lepidopterella palustris CBS 459.81]